MTDRPESMDVMLLTRLTELLEVPCDRATAIRHVESSRREKPIDEDRGAEAFALAARRAGLRVTSFTESIGAAVEQASPQTPLVVRLRRDAGHSWAVVLDQRGTRLYALLGPEDQPRWMSQSEVALHLGAGEADAPLDWLLIHAAAPCSDARASTDPEVAPPSPLTRLMAVLRPDRSDLWAVAIFAVAIGSLMLATPIAVQTLVNFVAFGGAVAPVIVLALMLAVGLGFAAVLSAMQAWIVEILQRRIFVRMVSDLAHRLPRVNRLTYYRKYGPELVNRFFDVITVQKMSALLLLDGLGVLLGVVIGLVVLAFYHPLLLAFDVLIILAVVVIVFVLGRSGVRTAIRESYSKYSVASWLEDIARNPVTFKAPAARDFVLHRSDELARGYVNARKAHYRVLFRQIIGMLLLQVAASVVLLGIGGFLVIRGELTLGQLVASELIVTYVVGSIAKMGKHFESFYDLMAAVDKLGALLDLPLERPTGEAWSREAPVPEPGIDRRRGAVASLKQVALGADSGRELFSKLSLEIESGERVGIAGPSGFGKSSLVELLYGSLDPSAGAVEIDGMDVRSIRLEALRQRVALISAPEIFEGTVLDNVLLGRSIPTETVQSALRRVGLLDACATLPDGILTRLTSKGAPFSDGQINRLMIARAIVGNPRLMLVDGLLDTMSRASVKEVLDVLTDRDAPWTLVVVSNREEVLSRCDRTIDLSARIESQRSAV